MPHEPSRSPRTHRERDDPPKQQQPASSAPEDLGAAVRDLSDLLERVAYGMIGFFATYLILKIGFGIGKDACAEAAVLNAGIAYYTHAATGRVIRALWVIVGQARPSVRRDSAQKETA